MTQSKRRSWFISDTTRAFWHEGQHAPGFSLWDFIHGYFYARWPYLYIGVGTGQHPLFKFLKPGINLVSWLAGLLPRRALKPGEKPVTFADTYHGKVVPLAAARQLVQIKQEISLPDLENVIPYALARDIIIKNPDHIVALDCPCRAARENPCLPLDVCLIVGEPFASFVSEHQPQRTRWITPAEATAILQAEDERGHVHHAFLKEAMLGRFYAICNCCACCCGAMQAHQHHTPMLASSGYLAKVDSGECAGCGACVEVCQFKAVEVLDGTACVDEAACMGCGICVNHCPQGALTLVLAPERGVPLAIEELIRAAV